MIPKTIKGFLIQLKELSEDTIISELKGVKKLTEDEESYLRGIIAAIQNELGEMPYDVWKKFNIHPYKGSK